jgi:polysaccharide biosynthesis transport protein
MSDLIRKEQTPSPPERYLGRPAWSSLPPEEENYIDFRRYIQIVLKHRWLIAAVVFTVVAVVAMQVFTTTSLYRSTVKIQIDPETGNILPYGAVGDYSEQFLYTDSYLQTQFEILQSRALARRVIDRLDLEEDPVFNAPVSKGLLNDAAHWVQSETKALFSAASPSDPALAFENPDESGEIPGGAGESAQDRRLAHRLISGVEVSPVRGSRVVWLSWSSPDPRFSRKVANALAEEFIELNLAMKYESTTKALEYLQAQMQEVKGKVEKSEEELLRYARSKNILNLTERENIIVQKLVDVNQQMTQVESALIANTAQFEAVRNATVENFPQSLKTESMRRQEDRLFALRQQLASLTSRFGSQWPEVVQTERQIAEVEEQIAEEKRDTLSRVQQEYDTALRHRHMLSESLERQKGLADRLSEDSIQYNILSREVETNRQLYEGLLQRLKEVGVTAGLRTSNIHIVDRGDVPEAPYSPRKANAMALAFAVGLALALGMAFIVEYFDNTLKTPNDIEEFLRLPSLGMIPKMGKKVNQAPQLLLPTAAGEAKSAAVVPFGQGKFRYWEAYRSLRTSILLSHSGKPPQKILVTSALPGEGKTTTVINTAIVLAQTGARTLIMDLDMRRTTLSGIFGMNGTQGLSAFLSGNSDLSGSLRQTSVPNLYVLPAGIRPPNPAELIGSERMEQALRLLSEYFKYIVIDSPPVLSVSDSLVISTQVDGVILVVRGGETPKDAVKKANAHLMAVGAPLLGAMINNVDLDSPEYVYYHGRYGYYDDEYNNAAAG